MIEVAPRLYVADLSACFYDSQPERAVVHACKDPCHRRALGYTGRGAPRGPHYLALRADPHLYLNIVDADRLGRVYGDQLFAAALGFIHDHIAERDVIVHCNLGQSRSPSIALAYLAARGQLANASFRDAAEDFQRVYPSYLPSPGVAQYLSVAWNDVLKFGQ